MGRVLRGWLLGQLVRSAIVAVCWPRPFICWAFPARACSDCRPGWRTSFPISGPLIAALPVALVAMPLGLSTLTWVMVIYFPIQTIEGFVIAPLIQKGAVNVPPAWTLFAIVLFGAMFGAIGVALAAPLVAVGRIAVLRFYVEDVLQIAISAVPAGRTMPSSIRSEQIGKERIGRRAQQRIEIDDQHAALAARRDRPEIDAELVAVVGLQAVERVVHGNGRATCDSEKMPRERQGRAAASARPWRRPRSPARRPRRCRGRHW